MTLWLAVAVAGAVGAPARYLVDGWAQQLVSGEFPAGTFVVNVAGSLILGALTGLAWYHGLGPLPGALVGTGFCGALTTFSTFTYETVLLAERGQWHTAAANVAANLAVGLGAAGAALAIVAAW